MLDDQPFLIDFTTFLSQCNRMTRTGLTNNVLQKRLSHFMFSYALQQSLFVEVSSLVISNFKVYKYPFLPFSVFETLFPQPVGQTSFPIQYILQMHLVTHCGIGRFCFVVAEN